MQGYVHVVLRSQLYIKTQTVVQVLAEELPLLMASLNFKRSMRWRGSTAYSRPLRWLMALHGSTALPFTYAGILASNTTRLLRNSASPLHQVRAMLCMLCMLCPLFDFITCNAGFLPLPAWLITSGFCSNCCSSVHMSFTTAC